MEGPATLRIVLLGESQNGKSSLANTIFGEAIFKVKEFNDAKSFTTEAKTKFVNGRNFTLIDTPGLFDSGRPQKTVKSELMRCMIESSPGPHIFLIILKVEKYTEQEKDVIAKIRRYFSDDALKYAAVIFTHGDQLPEGMNIQQYAAQSDGLWELVQKCGGRCHVFDNRYWRNNQEEEEYRSNKFQLAELFKTIDKILIKNKGGHFSNTILNEIETEIQKEIKLLKLSSENMSEDEIKRQVKSIVLKKQSAESAELPLWIKATLGVGVSILIFRWLKNTLEAPPLTIELLKEAGQKTVQQTTEDAIPNIFEFISNYLALYEKTYNPLCPFE